MKISTYEKWNIVIIFVLGFILHDLYKKTGIEFLAYITPTNESIWEHVKLISTPALLLGLIGMFIFEDYPNYLLGRVIGVIVAILFMVFTVYFLDVQFGISNLVSHLTIFFLSLIIMAYITYKISLAPKIQGAKVIGLLLFLVVFIGIAYLTKYPLDHEIFIEKSTTFENVHSLY